MSIRRNVDSAFYSVFAIITALALIALYAGNYTSLPSLILLLTLIFLVLGLILTFYIKRIVDIVLE